MGLCVVFVSGARRSGKSAVVRAMVDRVWKRPPHYIRLVASQSDKVPPPRCGSARPADCGVSSARWLKYAPDQIFEILPEALTEIHRQDRFGSVVIEADADAVLRHAYPYDHRIFVMPLPWAMGEVFREPRRAAVELQRVLDDTTSFASEMFGLNAASRQMDCDPSEERPALTRAQMRAFLHSPLGDELATRIQLQPTYQGLVESDVVVVNTRVGREGPETHACVQRLQSLLDRLRGDAGRASQLFACDPLSSDDFEVNGLLRALEPMCQGGK